MLHLYINNADSFLVLLVSYARIEANVKIEVQVKVRLLSIGLRDERSFLSWKCNCLSLVKQPYYEQRHTYVERQWLIIMINITSTDILEIGVTIDKFNVIIRIT